VLSEESIKALRDRDSEGPAAGRHVRPFAKAKGGNPVTSGVVAAGTPLKGRKAQGRIGLGRRLRRRGNGLPRREKPGRRARRRQIERDGTV
jgi:hypothetical protein